MKIRHAATHRMRCLLRTSMMVAPVMTVLLLPSSSFAQAARPASRIKKPLIYQVGNAVHINAEGPRPLLQALDALQGKYGWMVDYEDPQYPAESDAANPPALPQRRHANLSNSTRESFSVEFSAGPAPDSTPDESSVLAAVVDAYNQGNASGQFELRNKNERQQADRFAVVGIGVHGQNDEVISQQPILDRAITLTRESRTAEQTIVLICQKLSEGSNLPVTAEIAGSLRARGKVVAGGTGVPARTLLSRALPDKTGWRLLYDASGKRYELRVAELRRD